MMYQKKFIGIYVVLLIIGLFQPVFANDHLLPNGYTIPEYLVEAGYQPGSDFELTREVVPGVVHTFQSFAQHPYDNTTSDALVVNIVELDQSQSDLTLDAENATDLVTGGATLDQIAAKASNSESTVVAGINADFWDRDRRPINLHVDDGMIWKSPWMGNEGQSRSVFAFDAEGNVSLGQPDWAFMLLDLNTGDAQMIDVINAYHTRVADSTWVYAYNSYYGTELLAASSLYVAGKETVQRAIFKMETSEWLPNKPVRLDLISNENNAEVTMESGMLVLDFAGGLPDWLSEDDDFCLVTRMENLPGPVVGALGGLPKLVEGGKSVVARANREGINPEASFTTKRHPRSAVALKDDGNTVVLVTVDGRQPGVSVGINLNDLATMLIEMGCTEALNFDGGGSTTMYADGAIVNLPSDPTGPRPVANALLIRAEQN
jgi:uncharacterized protein YigE (DUF2233 family)